MSAKKGGFDRFVHKKESGAKLKEKIRQEKKKARDEKNAFFEQKKLERKQMRAQDSAAPQKPFRSKKSEDFRNAEEGRKPFGKKSFQKDDQRSFGGNKEGRSFKKSSYGRGGNEDRPKRSYSSDRPSFKKEGEDRFDRPSKSGYKKEGGSNYDNRESRSGYSKDKSSYNREDKRDSYSKGAGSSHFDKKENREFSKDRSSFNREDKRDGYSKGTGKGRFDKKDNREFSKDRGGKREDRYGGDKFEKKSSRYQKDYSDRAKVDFRSKDSIVEAPHLKAKPINEPIPLNKFLAHAGVSSRRDAADIVKEGKVHVNGEVVLEPGFKVTEKDEIKLNGKKLIARKNLVYILLNKPKDYITTTEDPQGRKTVLDIVKNATEERIYPIGRLDRNTTGVLLLTNDGELAQKLSHPSYEVKKIYEVRLDKDLTKADFDKLAAGLTLEDGFIQPDAVGYPDPKDKSVIGIEIHSGKNRIVRRIFEHLGYDVRNLDRVMYADLTKKNVDRGKWRFLSEKEVRILKFLNKSYSKNKKDRG